MYVIEAGPIRVTRNTNIEDNMIYHTEKEKAQDIADLRLACDIVRKDVRKLSSSVIRSNSGNRHISEINLESREIDLIILHKEIRDMMAQTVITEVV